MTNTIGGRSKPNSALLFRFANRRGIIAATRSSLWAAGQQEFFAWLSHPHPDLGIFGFGERIEVFKDVGLPRPPARSRHTARHQHVRAGSRSRRHPAAAAQPPRRAASLRDLHAAREALGSGFVDAYVKLRMVHWTDYMRHLTEWEREHTLNV
jgi:hypothetical protein